MNIQRAISRRVTLWSDARGMGLIEVIVTVAIISIVALGIATMLQDMFTQQARGAQKGVLNSTRARLIEILQSPSGWSQTVNAASNDASLACMRPGNTCTHNTTVNFNIVDQSGASFYPSATATAGFRPDGVTCDSFSTGTPDPGCPFRWAFSATLRCPGGAGTCASPDVQIVGAFSYSPGTGTFGNAFSPTTYGIDFRRGSAVTLNDPIVFRYRETDDTGEAGLCDTGAWIARQLNQAVDTNSVGATVTGGNQFNLPVGSYNCRVLAPGFKNGGNRIRVLRVTGSVVEAESTVSLAPVSSGGSVVNSIELVLRVNSGLTGFQVQQSCTSRPSAAAFGSVNDNFSLGVPVPDAGGSYANTTYTTVTCLRTGA